MMMSDKLTLSQYLEISVDECTSLPKLPTLVQLKLIRKGLRKKKIPDVLRLPNEFAYDGVGKFQIENIESDFTLCWTTVGSQSKTFLFSQLCSNTDLELDRLEFGWMIADFARKDGINYLGNMRPKSYSDFHQNQFNKEFSLEKKHFQKIELSWRHWAVVPAGHMVLNV
jgi:hypothetical protein